MKDYPVMERGRLLFFKKKLQLNGTSVKKSNGSCTAERSDNIPGDQRDKTALFCLPDYKSNVPSFVKQNK